MDKSTLSNYGWIIICILVLSVMIALSSPFSRYIASAVWNTTGGINDVNNNALDVIVNPNVERPDDNLIIKDPLLNPTDVVINNGQYTYGDYMYTEILEDGNIVGWKVSRVAAVDLIEYGEILESINRKPIKDIQALFYSCEQMIVSPKIPDSVENMMYAFDGCKALEKAPTLPKNVKNLYGAFQLCESLVDAPEIPSSANDVRFMFLHCKSLKCAPVIPDTITDIYSTFSGCTNLVTYKGNPNPDGDLSEYLTGKSIVDMSFAFASCKSIVVAPNMPSTVKRASVAFSNCVGLLTSPSISNEIENIDSIFDNCTSMTGSITLPCHMTIVGFENCGATIVYNHTPSCGGTCGK